MTTVPDYRAPYSSHRERLTAAEEEANEIFEAAMRAEANKLKTCFVDPRLTRNATTPIGRLTACERAERKTSDKTNP